MLEQFNATDQALWWSRYNADKAKWEVQDSTVVDEVAQTVGWKTDRFSEWTIVAGDYSGALIMVPSMIAIVGMAVFSVISVF